MVAQSFPVRSHHHGQGADIPGNAIEDLPTEAESRAWLEEDHPGYEAERAQWLKTRDSGVSNIIPLDTPESTHNEPIGYGSVAITIPVYTIHCLPAPKVAGLLPAPKPQTLNLRNGRTGEIHRKMSDGNYRVYVGVIDIGSMKFRTIEVYTAQQLQALNPGVTL